MATDKLVNLKVDEVSENGDTTSDTKVPTPCIYVHILFNICQVE